MNVLFSFLILHFPFRVCVECSGYADEVGFAFTEEEVGFFLCCDAACYEDRGEYAFLDGFGHVGEEAWFCVARSEDLAGAAGEVQEVDVFSFEEFGCCACVFDGAAAFFVVAASQAYGDDEVLIGFGFDASDDFEGKAEAVGDGLRSVFVVSVVGDRRVELVQEVSVCAVDFYAVIAGFLDAEGCCDVFLFQVVDFINGEGSCLVSGPFDVRGGDEIHACVEFACIGACVIDLREEADVGAHVADGFHHGFLCVDDGVVGKGNLVRVCFALWIDVAVLSDDHADVRVCCDGAVVLRDFFVRLAAV